MPQKKKIQGKFANKKGQVKFNLPVIEFQEDDNTIVYCPPLDLAGYGADSGEANEAFKVALREFCDYTITKGTLIKELKSLGWKTKAHHSEIKVPDLDVLIRSRTYLQEIFNTKNFEMKYRPIPLPVA
jgi:hypothetical protein